MSTCVNGKRCAEASAPMTDSHAILRSTAAKPSSVLNGHSGAVWSCSFYPDKEEVLASGSSDRTVRVVSQPYMLKNVFDEICILEIISE